jgi:hypothetical protein
VLGAADITSGKGAGSKLENSGVVATVQNPAQVAAVEPVFPWQPHPPTRIVVGFPVDAIPDVHSCLITCDTLRSCYCVAIIGQRHDRIALIYTASASWKQVLEGYIHALLLERSLDNQSLQPPYVNGNSGHLSVREADKNLVEQTRSTALKISQLWLTQLEKAGWWLGQPLLERDARMRLQLHKEAT